MNGPGAGAPHPLELKIPPPVVALLAAAAMWGVTRIGPVLPVAHGTRLLASGLLAGGGVALAASGVWSFHRANTTIHPDRPQQTSALVSSGPYVRTRNPMYLGLLLVLCAWAVTLGSPWALSGPLLFALYVNRFQIAPEERVLRAKFAGEYERYCASVRRWL